MSGSEVSLALSTASFARALRAQFVHTCVLSRSGRVFFVPQNTLPSLLPTHVCAGALPPNQGFALPPAGRSPAPTKEGSPPFETSQQCVHSSGSPGILPSEPSSWRGGDTFATLTPSPKPLPAEGSALGHPPLRGASARGLVGAPPLTPCLCGRRVSFFDPYTATLTFGSRKLDLRFAVYQSSPSGVGPPSSDLPLRGTPYLYAPGACFAGLPELRSGRRVGQATPVRWFVREATPRGPRRATPLRLGQGPSDRANRLAICRISESSYFGLFSYDRK